jgi:hypothetical protein
MVLGVTPANPAYVYLVQILSSSKKFQALLRSEDSGESFITKSTYTSPKAINIFDYECDGSGSASQATYDLCIAVDPNNADAIYVGSINNWKSTDGGINWTLISHWSENCSGSGLNVTEVHADQHCYEWNDGKLYVGNDGGISYTANSGTSWTEVTGNLPITQIYKLGQSATQNDLMLYGQQDNGSNSIVGGVLTTIRGGDGMECLVDYTNTNYCYTTSTIGKIGRSVNGPTGPSNSTINYLIIGESGKNGITESGNWVTPYFLHKTDPTIMFAGYYDVWRTTNVKAEPNTSVSWSKISASSSYQCVALDQSSADLNIIYVSRDDGDIKRTDNANAAAAAVTWTTCAKPSTSSTITTDIKTHPTDANIVYATAGYDIFKSTNKGASWTDISGTLPNLFINCMVTILR